MTDIVYWGNGDQVLGEYPAPKKISQANRQCAGGLFWDSGSAFGENIVWSVKEPYLRCAHPSRCIGGWNVHTKFVYIFPSDPLGRWIRSTDSFAATNPNLGNCCPHDRIWTVRVNDSPLGVISRNNCGTRISYSALPGIVYNWTDGTPSKGSTSYLVPIAGHTPTLEFVSGKIFIYGSDNDGEFDLIDPSSIQVGDQDAIAITYADSTTEEIPLNSCPEWVRIREDDECPDGTCRVECADHYCCYGCDGKPVKEIPK